MSALMPAHVPVRHGYVAQAMEAAMDERSKADAAAVAERLEKAAAAGGPPGQVGTVTA